MQSKQNALIVKKTIIHISNIIHPNNLTKLIGILYNFTTFDNAILQKNETKQSINKSHNTSKK